ncbi:MBL fold metallo-hydrolase [Pseudodesulfovibrio thermohalotolerans]|uniref:MBL fold metallo-hydrolase n=1 Tax=Pseudodesulfovibrio thermohalotolerans TaxID=2880651 RepID=UPI002441442C|nr:MBL fold metallo-hydrolase [Pseudodesulfovibrio thermohalotolerans]WFS63418.1 MBL fold metallo-hydrolase [Pseudodesulfovibrio thermohalotolerans]
MQCEIIYIHHNAFVLRTDRRTFLFDYPEDEHLPEGAGDLVRRAVAGDDLVVFISHGHGDHCNGNLASVTSSASRVRYVISDDVDELRPEAVPGNGETLLVEPDQVYEFGGMSVETLMSNDLGVAFLVEDGGFRFFHGGDLAEWIWPGASSVEAAFTERFFREAMERARDFKPHVAFADVDPRLPNLAGGVKACRIIGAPVFVPMHTFGDVSALSVLAGESGQGRSRVFSYSGMGDSKQFHF